MSKPTTLWEATQNLKKAFTELSDLLPKAEDALPNMLGSTKKADPEPELYFIDYAMLPIRYLVLPIVQSTILDFIRSEYKQMGVLPPGVGILNNEEPDDGETKEISAQADDINVDEVRPASSDGRDVAGDSTSSSSQNDSGKRVALKRSKNKKDKGEKR